MHTKPTLYCTVQKLIATNFLRTVHSVKGMSISMEIHK